MTATETAAVQAATKVHCDDVAANTRRGGDMRVTLSPRTAGCTSGFGGRLTLPAGDHVTRHAHPYSEEFLHVIDGTLEITVDAEVITLGPGDSVLIPVHAAHRLVNVGEDPALLIFHLSPLAPRPELGHIDLEDVAADQPNPAVQ